MVFGSPKKFERCVCGCGRWMPSGWKVYKDLGEWWLVVPYSRRDVRNQTFATWGEAIDRLNQLVA